MSQLDLLRLVTMPNPQRLLEHLTHKLRVVYYGDRGEPVNVAIECETCYEVILDFDQP
jgi:hypothetical protein